MVDTSAGSMILKQIGNGALMMMGAYDKVAIEDGVQFGIRGSRLVSKVVVKLDRGTDTYDVVLYNGRGVNFHRAAEYSDVYCDQLRHVIGKASGLAVSL